MRSDTNFVKIFGIIGAICVLLSTFMNVVTLKLCMGTNENADAVLEEYIIEDEASEEAEATEDVEVRMKYGLTMWEIRGVMQNLDIGLGWDTSDRDECIEALDSIDKDLYNDMFGMYGMEFRENTLQNVFDFFRYVISTYSLFLVLPFALVVVCVVMLAGTIMSKKSIKTIATLFMIAGWILLLIPSKNFFGIMGVGPVVMMCGIVSSLISMIGSYVSPGVIYTEQ